MIVAGGIVLILWLLSRWLARDMARPYADWNDDPYAISLLENRGAQTIGRGDGTEQIGRPDNNVVALHKKRPTP